MKCEFRTGLSRAQCSIAYNGNMGVCNQCQRYRWRLTVPGLLCSSRVRVFIELAYREISVQQTPENENVGSEKRDYAVESKIYIQNDDVWYNTSLVSRNIAAEKPEEKFVRKQRFIDPGYKICLSLFDRILPSIRDTDERISNGILLYLIYIYIRTILNFEIRIKEIYAPDERNAKHARNHLSWNAAKLICHESGH